MKMAKDEKRVIRSGAEQREEISEDEIDNNLMGSFPASDPPSWTLGTDHREETQTEKVESSDGSPEE
jgi:hypothetical protein